MDECRREECEAMEERFDDGDEVDGGAGFRNWLSLQIFDDTMFRFTLAR